MMENPMRCPPDVNLPSPELRRSSDGILLDRALSILHRMATENTGRQAVFRRWYYSDEPLRNDAANLVRDAGFGMMQPINTRLVGDEKEGDMSNETADLQMFNSALEKALVAECDSQRARIKQLEAVLQRVVDWEEDSGDLHWQPVIDAVRANLARKEG